MSVDFSPDGRGRWFLCAVAVLGLLVLPVATAGGGEGSSPSAGESAKGKRGKLQRKVKRQGRQLRNLRKRLAALERRVDPEGPPGTPTAVCEGNDRRDAMVKVGTVCMDRYEASVWSQPDGGIQYGTATDDYPCSDTGQDCAGKIFARSVAGVTPSRSITWFQAQQALLGSGKRFLWNAEWQAAVAGTPVDAPCNVSTGALQSTGASAGCISAHGVTDMVGNLWEWVADWDEEADTAACGNWPADFGLDQSCFSNPAPSGLPGALLRGGDWHNGADAGPFAIFVGDRPSHSNNNIGFRGAR